MEHADEARADLRALPSIYEQLRRGGLANTSPSIVEQITAVLPNLAPTQPILDGVPSVDQLHALELSGSSLGFYARLKRAETVLCAIVAGLGLPHPVPEQFAGIDTEQVAPFVGSVPRLSLTEFKEMQHVIDAFQMPRSSHTASLRLVAYNVVALHGRLSLHLYERAALDRI